MTGSNSDEGTLQQMLGSKLKSNGVAKCSSREKYRFELTQDHELHMDGSLAEGHE